MNELTNLARQFLEQKQRTVKTPLPDSSSEAVPETVADTPPSQADDVVAIEPATCTPVWFESLDGVLHGPCPVLFVGRTGEPAHYEFWFCVEVEGLTHWIRDSLLRTAPGRTQARDK